MDGTHTICKKGGESVAYQGRKKAKTCNIIPLVDGNGIILCTGEIVSGNHNDGFELTKRVKSYLKDFKSRFSGTVYLNGDSGFDTKEVRKLCWNNFIVPNIKVNPRNSKKKGRPSFFNQEVYNKRFCIERTFGWCDKFKRILIRFERKDSHFLAFNLLAFTLINLRTVLQKV